MPVSNNYNVVEYAGNSSGRDFNFPFRCFSLDHLVVELITVDDSTGEETVKTLVQNTEYSVSGGLDNSGGSIHYPLPTEEPAITADQKIRIYRSTPMSQDIDYPTYQQAIENALDKSAMVLQEVAEGAKGAKESIDGFEVRVAGVEGVAAGAVQTATELGNSANETAGNAVTIAQGADTTARLASGNASIAVSTANEADAKADQAVADVEQAVEDVEYAVDQVNGKLNTDGSNIERIPFLDKLLIDPDGTVHLEDFALTSGGNIDVAAYRFGLGIDELDNKVGVLESSAANTNGSNIDTAAYSQKLGLSDLANTAGTNLDVVGYKAALAPRIVTTLAGITGNYVGEQVLRISGVADDPEDDIYFWDGTNWCKEGI